MPATLASSSQGGGPAREQLAERLGVEPLDRPPLERLRDCMTTVAVGKLDDKELDDRREAYGLRRSDAW